MLTFLGDKEELGEIEPSLEEKESTIRILIRRALTAFVIVIYPNIIKSI